MNIPMDNTHDGQYTYRYMQEWNPLGEASWENIEEDGWGVKLTNKDSTEPVTSELCSSINGKPIVSMHAMFYKSKATSGDLSTFNTSHVTDMSIMFEYSKFTNLDLSSFDTSNVTNMGSMFFSSSIKKIQARTIDDANKICTQNQPIDSNQTADLYVTGAKICEVFIIGYMN